MVEEPREKTWQSEQPIAAFACDPVVIGKVASGCVPMPAIVGHQAAVLWQSAQVCANELCPGGKPPAEHWSLPGHAPPSPSEVAPLAH
jgi:hypothetical protein